METVHGGASGRGTAGASPGPAAALRAPAPYPW
jgi:hypothetical protein